MVLFHAVLGFTGRLSGSERLLKAFFGFGHEAVAIFIVLSGYCLMLPVARAPHGELAGGVRRYFARRAWRILPPYYAALGIALGLIAAIPALRQPGSGTIWDDSLPGLAAGPVATHLLLLHNWFPLWAYQINGPLWSVATEWQIYFFFPLVLLPLWRRFGWGVALATAAAIGYAPLLLSQNASTRAVPWYLLLFALGMLAATLSFGERTERFARVRWGTLALVTWCACALGGTLGARSWFRFLPLTDLLIGCASALLLVYCAEQAKLAETGAAPGKAPPPPLLRLLQSPLLLAIGHFSYSLYLTHLPVVALCYFGLRALAPLHGFGLAGAMVVTSVPASLAFAYVFHVAVERRFVRANGRAT